MNTVNKNIGYMVLAQFGKFIVPLITFPYLTRVLGLESYGLLIFGLAISTYLTMVTQFGFNLSAVEQVTRHLNDKARLLRVVCAILNTQLLIFLGLSSALVLLLVILDIAIETQLIIYCFLPNVVGTSLLVQWFHQGMERMANVALYVIVGRVVSLPLVFVLVNGPEDAWIAALLHASGILLAGAISLVAAIRQSGISGYYFEPDEILSQTLDSSPLFVTNAAASLYTESVPVLIGIIAGAASVGLYNAAQVFRNIAFNLMEAILQSIFPRSIRYYNEDRAEMRLFLRKYLKLTLALCIAGVLFTVTLAEQLVTVAAGDEFASATPVLQVLICTVLIGLLNNFLGVQVLIPYGHKKAFSRVVVSSGLISLLFIAPLAYFAGALGAAISVLCTELIILVGLIRLHRQHQIDVLNFWSSK